jgi:hypothetical protein
MGGPSAAALGRGGHANALVRARAFCREYVRSAGRHNATRSEDLDSWIGDHDIEPTEPFDRRRYRPFEIFERRDLIVLGPDRPRAHGVWPSRAFEGSDVMPVAVVRTRAFVAQTCAKRYGFRRLVACLTIDAASGGSRVRLVCFLWQGRRGGGRGWGHRPGSRAPVSRVWRACLGLGPGRARPWPDHIAGRGPDGS